jgi:NAD+ synthase (glutamine-hydrolysing)
MRVTIAQINTTNGDLKGNTQKIIQAIEKARVDGSDLVVFPEVVTHGYTSQDWFQDPDIIEHCEEPLREIVPEDKRADGRARHDLQDERERGAKAF